MNMEQMQKFKQALLKIEELEKRIDKLEAKKKPGPKPRQERLQNAVRQSNS
jgi:hypothetical protein